MSPEERTAIADKFKCGDFVIMRKPDIPYSTSITWQPLMDKFDGRIVRLSHRDGDFFEICNDDYTFNYDPMWFEPVDIKDGDKVIIHKPIDTDEYPSWDYEMDKYDGREVTIRYLSKFDDDFKIEEDDDGWYFSTKWCELVTEEEIELEDEEFLDFIGGFKRYEITA